MLVLPRAKVVQPWKWPRGPPGRGLGDGVAAGDVGPAAGKGGPALEVAAGAALLDGAGGVDLHRPGPAGERDLAGGTLGRRLADRGADPDQHVAGRLDEA